MRVLTHELVPRCVAYSPDGTLMACGDEGGVTLYSLPSAEVAARLPVEGQSVEAIGFSPRGDYLAAGGVEDLFVWEMAGRRLHAKAVGHENGTRAVVWRSDGKIWLSTGWDRKLFWHTAALTRIATGQQEGEPITCLALHPDGKLLAGGGSQRSLVFWQLTDAGMVTPQTARWVVEVPQPTFALAATRDGQLLAAGHADGRVSLWDFARRVPVGDLIGHEWVVYGVAFSPDGSRLVSGSADGTVRLWDVPHRRLVETYRFHKSWVTCVAVSPDGMTAAAGSDDLNLILWDLAD